MICILSFIVVSHIKNILNRFSRKSENYLFYIKQGVMRKTVNNHKKSEIINKKMYIKFITSMCSNNIYLISPIL